MVEEFQFLPKPFVFLNDIVPKACTPVYLPERICHTDPDCTQTCVCVHVCEQFHSYKTTDWGIKVIPDDAKCKFAEHGVCNGSCLVKNLRITNTPVHQSWIRREVMSGLHRPGR